MAVNIQNYREMTTAEIARIAIWKEPERFDPIMQIREVISTSPHKEYFGQNTNTKNPLSIPSKAINHILACGYTRSGKGIFSHAKGAETIIKKQGLIYIDVKQEEFAPAVFQKILKDEGRPDDMHIVNWPTNFGYSGLHETDTVHEIHEKAVVLFGLEPTDHPGVDHYRGNGRMTLLKILTYGLKNNHISKDWNDLLSFLEAMKDDIEAKDELSKEVLKKYPDKQRIERLSQRYFDENFYSDLAFVHAEREAIKSLYIKLYELIGGANVHNEHEINKALYEQKVLYIKADMNNIASLQFLKLLFIDIAQQVRKKKANVSVIADEISFYATSSLSAQLATMAGFGVRYILQLQDLGQIPEQIRAPILTNCTAKLFYKASDPITLAFLEKLGGVEPVAVHTKNYDGPTGSVRVMTEPILNATRLRAMWCTQHAVLIAEYFPSSIFITTSYIIVDSPFSWEQLPSKTIIKKEFKKQIQIKEDTEYDEIKDDTYSIETVEKETTSEHKQDSEVGTYAYQENDEEY